jgi:hypothetical protein
MPPKFGLGIDRRLWGLDELAIYGLLVETALGLASDLKVD